MFGNMIIQLMILSSPGFRNRIKEYFIFNTTIDQQGNNMRKQNLHGISTISAIFTIIASAEQNIRALIHLSEIPMKYPSTKNNAPRSYIEKYIIHWE